jgi:hypothetical protein
MKLRELKINLMFFIPLAFYSCTVLMNSLCHIFYFYIHIVICIYKRKRGLMVKVVNHNYRQQ